MKAKFLVVEGSDGSGKATQVKLLNRYLSKHNITHKTISIPRYKENIYGNFIANYLRGDYGDPLKISPYLSCLPYAVDRLLAKPLIEKWLGEVSLVIADRYAYSNFAFGAAKLPENKKQEFIKWIYDLEFNENKIPKEDLVLYLYIPVAISQKLMAGRKKDGHEINVTYQQEVEKEYLLLAKRKNWVTINCLKNEKLQAEQEIHQLIIDTLKKKGLLG